MTQTRKNSDDADNVSSQRSLDAKGDVILLPIDDFGAPGEVAAQVLKRLNLNLALIPGPNALTAGYAFVNAGKQHICFVVAVGASETSTIVARNLRAALRDPVMKGAREIWIALMGTGAGGLSFQRSEEIIRSALSATEWREQRGVHITIALPPLSDMDRTPIPYNVTILDAFYFASTLPPTRSRADEQTSTALLFLALAESQSELAPTMLRDDRTASLFSGAVHSLAGSRYRIAWDHYFLLGSSAKDGPTERPDVQHASDVKAILREAERHAWNVNSSSVELDDLIIALLSFSDGGHSRVARDMGFSLSALLREYRDAITGQIGKTLLNDVAAQIDRLGYDRYADAIKDFLIDKATEPPLSISIQAPWGAGKSSLMLQIREKIDPSEEREKYKKIGREGRSERLRLRDVLAFLDQKRKNELSEARNPKRLWTVWFNAWKYDTTEQVWAGLVDTIVSQISERLRPADRELFLLRLQLARIDDAVVRRKIYDRILTMWWTKVRAISISGAAAIASLLGISSADRVLGLNLPKSFSFSPMVVSIALCAYLAFNYFKTREKAQAEPASFSLAQYLQVPDYSRSLGTVHHIHKDLLRVLSVTPRALGDDLSSPLVVFIDDLDRCSPSSVANVVEGVSMFLASEVYRCMFVIGMDPQLIAAALEESHASIREHLPRYERTVPLGWRFMDKFIQLPFTIPPNKNRALEAYVDWLSGAENPTNPLSVTSEPAYESSSSQQIPKSDEESLRQKKEAPIASNLHVDDSEDAVAMFRESRDVGAIIREAAKFTSGNPREIKRLANIARLYLGLRNSARLRDPNWLSPSPGQYARWIVLTLKWPDMMRWLQWGADEGSWHQSEKSTDLLLRRVLLLEYIASEAQTIQRWTENLVDHLSASGDESSGWVRDSDLYGFFKANAKLAPAERLSAAVARGFW